MYNSNSENIQIKTLYAPGFSSLAMSYFRTYLTLDFSLWLSMDSTGKSQYDKTNRLSTTVSHEGAKSFYQIAKSIIDGSDTDKQINTVFSCKRDTDLIFEYRPESDGQMMAYLTISKENKTIRFWFPTRQYDEVDEEGQTVTTVIQVGLGAFAKVMYGYLARTGAADGLDKLPENFNEYQNYSKQVSSQEMWSSVYC